MGKLARFIYFFTTDSRNNDGPTTGWLKRISTPAAVMNITDAVAKPVCDLVIAIEPVQTGSGDPSPTNVRPISGWTGVTVSRSGADTSNPTTFSVSWQSDAGTVYGGTLDLTTGLLTVTHKKLTFTGTENWKYHASGFFYYTLFAAGVCANGAYLTENGVTLNINVNNGQCRVNLNSNTFLSSSSDLHDYLTSSIGFVYTLATPETYQLTPTEVKTLLGENYIWADTGSVNSIAYYSTDETCSPIVGTGKVGSMSIA